MAKLRYPLVATKKYPPPALFRSFRFRSGPPPPQVSERRWGNGHALPCAGPGGPLRLPPGGGGTRL